MTCGRRSVDECEVSAGDRVVDRAAHKDDDAIGICNEDDCGRDESLEIRRFPSKKH